LWQCRVLVGSLLPTSTRHCQQQRMTITRSCIDTVFLLMMIMSCSKHVESYK